MGTSLMIDDVPADVTVLLKRARHLVNKCILLIEDDQYDDEEKVAKLIESGMLTGHRNALLKGTKLAKLAKLPKLDVKNMGLNTRWFGRKKPPPGKDPIRSDPARKK